MNRSPWKMPALWLGRPCAKAEARMPIVYGLPFRRCVSREPMPRKGSVGSIAGKEQSRYATAKQSLDLAADRSGSAPALPAGVTPAEAAAWTVAARVMLNLDETITKQ